MSSKSFTCCSATVFHPAPGNHLGTCRTVRREKGRCCWHPRRCVGKEERLTERDHIDKESSRLRGFRKCVHSSPNDLQNGVVVLLDRIPMRDLQNDGPRSPNRA
jgi:hypothetical protein